MQIVRRPAPANNVVTISPVPYDKKPQPRKLCIFDTETDPFAEGRVVAPFACGFLEVESGLYWDFWGDDCIDQFFAFLADNYEPGELLIYAHNGGNFDFYFCTDHFDEGMKPFIINGRLVSVTMKGQEFRDSYACLPFALSEYQKTEIDYAKFERPARERHKAEILAYQKDDCLFLADLMSGWLDMFGNKLTIASAALPLLRSFHGFENMTEFIDEQIRPYYFGGRCQAFDVGELSGNWKIYDVNSMYPHVMATVEHPISSTPFYETKITKRTHFAHIRAWSDGALPIRNDTGGLSFPVGINDFFACIHEINAGLETGTLKILKVYSSIYFKQKSTFDKFVYTLYDLRQKAGEAGDFVRKLLYKYGLNSPYGKFAQDPRNYENWLFDPADIPTPKFCAECYSRAKNKEARQPCELCDGKSHSPYGWYLHTVRGDKHIYAKPSRASSSSGFYNVATAASITSAARAVLLRGIAAAKRPIYCDTDSLICEALEGVELDDKKLGAWKLEASGDVACIAGKKLYAVFDNGEEIKKASKGVKLTGEEIARVCRGDVVEYANPVPKFSMFKPERAATIKVNEMVNAEFVTRRIQRTYNQ